jgi:hypothetical protein
VNQLKEYGTVQECTPPPTGQTLNQYGHDAKGWTYGGMMRQEQVPPSGWHNVFVYAVNYKSFTDERYYWPRLLKVKYTFP